MGTRSYLDLSLIHIYLIHSLRRFFRGRVSRYPMNISELNNLKLLVCIEFQHCGGDVACSESVPSVTVALHVTKRQNGATARYRGSVTGGINGTVTSHEARGVGAVG